MSWGYPAESSGSASTWQNQVAYSCYYGPSGAIDLIMYGILLTIPRYITLSIAFRAC